MCQTYVPSQILWNPKEHETDGDATAFFCIILGTLKPNGQLLSLLAWNIYSTSLSFSGLY